VKPDKIATIVYFGIFGVGIVTILVFSRIKPSQHWITVFYSFGAIHEIIFRYVAHERLKLYRKIDGPVKWLYRFLWLPWAAIAFAYYFNFIS